MFGTSLYMVLLVIEYGYTLDSWGVGQRENMAAGVSLEVWKLMRSLG